MRLPFRPMLAAALVAVFVAGCSAPALQEQQPVDPQPREPGGALATYLHGLSERDERVRFADARLEQHRIPAEDGVELDTWVAVPPGEGPFPVVLRITPYYAGGPPAGLGRLGEELLGRGYAVALSTVRGTGTSGGCFHQGSEQEARDGAAVVEALAALPWSNGNVGMVGVSYDGTTPQNVWLESPPALKTIVPISGISDFYKYNFVNGVPIVIQGFGFNAYYWLFEDALFDMGGPGSQDPREVVHALQGAACAEQVDVQLGGATSTATGDKNAYWQSRDLVARLAARVEEGRPPAASVLYVHGLQDWNVKPHHMEDWLQAVQATGVPFKAMLGQWGHAWPQATARDARCMPDADGVAACRTDWWDQVLVAWFDQFLKGKETGILDAPAVQVQDDDGVWRHEDAWPPADARWHGLRLAAAGRLVAEGDAPGATVSWVDGSHAVTTLPRAFWTGPVQYPMFRSEPFAEDVRVSGQPAFVGNLTADGPRASFLLTLAEELPDGSLRPFNYAAQSLNHVTSLEAGAASVAGLRQQVEVRFFPQDDVVHAGSRVVLVVGGAFLPGGPGPALQPVAAGAVVQLETGGAWLRLPLDTGIVAEDPQPHE